MATYTNEDLFEKWRNQQKSRDITSSETQKLLTNFVLETVTNITCELKTQIENKVRGYCAT